MKKYFYSLLMLALGSCVFISCSSDDDSGKTPTPEPTFTATGLFILNEGNYYSNINGSLSYLGYETGTVTDNVFQSINGRSLGGTPNDMIEVDSRLYICCTDENRLEIVEAKSGKSVSYVEVPQPREVCSSDDGIYVTSYDGTVYCFNLDGKKVAQSEKIGACLEGITYRDGYLYVCNAYNSDYTYNTNVVKLNATSLANVKDITVAANPTQIEYDGGLIYVLSTGNYADVQGQIQTIDANDNVTYLCDATLMAIDGNDVFAINSVTDWATYKTTTDYFVINGTSGSRATLFTSANTKEIYSPCGIAVDTLNKNIFVSSYNYGAGGYADYSANGYIMQFNYDGTFVKKYDVGVGPTTMLTHVEQKVNSYLY